MRDGAGEPLSESKNGQNHENEAFEEDSGQGGLVRDIACSVIANYVESEVGVESWMILSVMSRKVEKSGDQDVGGFGTPIKEAPSKRTTARELNSPIPGAIAIGMLARIPIANEQSALIAAVAVVKSR